ncbi:MAG: ABC transporter ATP-binding protein [Anaerolineae bacterium]|nr:ABC transporter ATP-binding protein [Thermoflexales bacterium]MDW8408158.1 ABC transporter ATP-binding protein [Anaerolineae bacterium]
MIDTRELTRLSGQKAIVDRVSIQIEAGCVFGLVGPHGAGKTTFLRILATLLPPTHGDAVIGGASIRRHADRVRRITGYLPETDGVYADMTAAEYVRFFAACYGVPASERNTLVDDLLALVDLAHCKDTLAGKLSRGMRRRLNLARTLVHDPSILLLDNPAAGLDPRARIELRELIQELRSMGKTIVLTSRSLAEVQDLCTHLGIMADGRLLITGESADLCSGIEPHRTIAVKFFGDVESAVHHVRNRQGVIEAKTVPLLENHSANTLDASVNMMRALKEMHITFAGDYSDASDLLRHLVRAGVQVVSFAEKDDELEKILGRFNLSTQAKSIEQSSV